MVAQLGPNRFPRTPMPPWEVLAVLVEPIHQRRSAKSRTSVRRTMLMSDAPFHRGPAGRAWGADLPLTNALFNSQIGGSRSCSNGCITNSPRMRPGFGLLSPACTSRALRASAADVALNATGLCVCKGSEAMHLRGLSVPGGM